jgi:outer membrane protein assembly factor BamB
MKTLPTILLSCGLASAASLPALGDSRDASAPSTAPTTAAIEKTYLVTAIAHSAAGDAVVNEALTFAPDGDGVRLFLANSDGTTFSSPVTFAPDGTIASSSQDGAITCYNMAMSVLASRRATASGSAAGTAAVYVIFGGSVVRVPLGVRTDRVEGTARSIALLGESRGMLSNGTVAEDAGIVITAEVEERRGDLRAAAFDEVHYLGDVSHVVGRSTCTVARAQQGQARPA